MSDRAILVVEDNQDNLDLVREILEDANYSVLGTDSAENAIDILNRGLSVGLILMDISLPRLNGYEATKIIKQDSKFKHIPVIMLTANALKEHRDKGFDAGCSEYLTKPIVDEDAFLATVAKFFSKE